MGAIFDLRHTQTPNNIIIFYFVFYGTENMFLPLHCVAIMSISWDTCNYIISAAILDFWRPVSSGSVTDSTIETFNPENMEVVVGILLLTSLEAEIPLWGSFTPTPFNTNVTKITFNIWGLSKQAVRFREIHAVCKNVPLI